jgi:hypothetical protein
MLYSPEINFIVLFMLNVLEGYYSGSETPTLDQSDPWFKSWWRQATEVTICHSTTGCHQGLIKTSALYVTFLCNLIVACCVKVPGFGL